MSEPQTFAEYLQTLPSDSPIRAASQRYTHALNNVIDDISLNELKAAATTLRNLLEESPDSGLAIVAAFIRVLIADTQLVGALQDAERRGSAGV